MIIYTYVVIYRYRQGNLGWAFYNGATKDQRRVKSRILLSFGIKFTHVMV